MDIDEEKIFIPEVVKIGGQDERREAVRPDKVKLGCAISGVSYLLMTALGAIIYIWTIVVAYHAAGFFAAVLSLIFPVFAQIFWGIQLWVDTGTIMNPYCLTLLGYLLAAVLVRAGIILFQNNIKQFSK